MVVLVAKEYICRKKYCWNIDFSKFLILNGYYQKMVIIFKNVLFGKHYQSNQYSKCLTY